MESLEPHKVTTRPSPSGAAHNEQVQQIQRIQQIQQIRQAQRIQQIQLIRQAQRMQQIQQPDPSAPCSQASALMTLNPGPVAASQWSWQQQQQGYDCGTIAAAGAAVPRSRPTAQMRPPCVSGSYGATLMVLPPHTQPATLPQQTSFMSSLPVLPSGVQ